MQVAHGLGRCRRIHRALKLPRPAKAREVSQRLELVGSTIFRDFPWRGHHRSMYELFVAEVLLQKTVADRVVPAYSCLINAFPTPHALAEASGRDIARICGKLGLVSKRIVSLIDGAKVLRNSVDSLSDIIPYLRNVSGVGDYTLNAMAIFFEERAVPIVDANIRRLLTRLFWVANCDQLVAQISLQLIKEAEKKATVAYAMLDLSALVCKPVPTCSKCPIFDLCEFPAKSAIRAVRPPARSGR